ncbi:TPA: type 1 fimbrial protein [Citrobacter werkmanii]|nr:type 1 fimbrial protein [Citrobacter werkmanii]
MYRHIVFWGIMLWAGVLQAAPSSSFPPSGMSLTDYWGEENVWWHGRATFSGEVIAPACVLAMEDAWQAVEMGETPLRELQNTAAGPEKRFQIRLRECDLARSGRQMSTGSRVRVTFDGVRDETPDRFSTTGAAKGVSLQILDGQGYIARAGEVMPARVLSDEQALDYTLRLVRNQDVLSAGSYYASIRFRVDYE